MHSVHTQLTLAARMVCPRCAKCTQAPRAGAVCREHASHAADRVAGPSGRVVALYRAPCMVVSQPWLCCIVTQPAATPSAPLSRYTQLYRDTPTPGCPLVTIHPMYCDPISSVFQAALATIQNLYRDTAFPQPNGTLTRLCHDTIFHCIVTQFG